MAKKKKSTTPALAANRALMQAMQLIRRSNATSPIPSGKRYKRIRKQDY